MAIKRPHVLFFSASSSLSAADIEAVESYGWANVGFRNAEMSSGIEPCDAVAGSVPRAYFDAGIPHADDYRATMQADKAAKPAKPAKEPAKAAGAPSKPPQSAPITAPPQGGWASPAKS